MFLNKNEISVTCLINSIGGQKITIKKIIQINYFEKK